MHISFPRKSAISHPKKYPIAIVMLCNLSPCLVQIITNSAEIRALSKYTNLVPVK